MLDWLQNHPVAISFIAGGSALLFIAGLIAMPFIVSRIPADYFIHDRRPPSRFAHLHPARRVLVLIGRNLLAAALILSGVAMLVLPGQGLLTVLVGFLLLDVPGKYRLEKWLIARRWVIEPINWLRRRRGKQPLALSRDYKSD